MADEQCIVIRRGAGYMVASFVSPFVGAFESVNVMRKHFIVRVDVNLFGVEVGERDPQILSLTVLEEIESAPYLHFKFFSAVGRRDNESHSLNRGRRRFAFIAAFFKGFLDNAAIAGVDFMGVHFFNAWFAGRDSRLL